MASISQVKEEVETMCIKALLISEQDSKLLVETFERVPGGQGHAAMFRAFLYFRQTLEDVAHTHGGKN